MNSVKKKKKMKFLGHIISHGSMKVNPRKVEAIESWFAPAIVVEFRSFLGLAHYY